MTSNLINDYINANQYNQQFDKKNVVKSQVETPSVVQANSPSPVSSNDSLIKGAYIGGTWLGLNKLNTLFNKSCSKDEYKKTCIGRMGNFGDKIETKFLSTNLGKKINTSFKNFKIKTANFINKSPVLSSMFNTPTHPECKMVKGFSETQQIADLTEAARNLTDYIDNIPKSLKKAGATKSEIKAFQTKYGKGLLGGVKDEYKAILEFQFDKLGAGKGYIDTLPPDKILEELKSLKLAKLQLHPDKYKNILSNPAKNASVIEKACLNGASATKNAKHNLTKNLNKLLTETSHTTKLGKTFAKLPKLLMRGLTFGGGPINTLLVAFGLGTAFYNTHKAPKDKKVGTAAAGVVDATSWIVSIPIAIKMMYGINGLQYIGKNKIQVGRYRVALKNFNKMAKEGAFKDIASYNAEWAKVLAYKNVGKPLTKPQKLLKKAGHILSVGLETKAPFKASTEGLTGHALRAVKMGNLKNKIPYVLKNVAAYPLRFAAYMFIFQPIVDKVISGITQLCFGKSYDPEVEKEKAEKEINKNINSLENTKKIPTEKKQINKTDINNLSDDNLLKRKLNGEEIIKQPRYIPSEKCEIPNRKIENERTYIPEETAPPSTYNIITDEELNKLQKDLDKINVKIYECLNK